jgi:molecular chaperone DnaK (HSP70)
MNGKMIIGIDLGTTNSAVAYLDPAGQPERVHIFSIPQLVAPGEVESRETLPSFHYQPRPEEAGSLQLPWEQTQRGDFAVGAYAREFGTDSPERLIASAKSWLCHTGVDRTAPLLPWHGASEVKKLSPAAASAAYLQHIRSAWNHQWPNAPLEEQEVVVTIPASFDEIARELTVTAARLAGLPRITLIEEPQSAFYAWTYNQEGQAPAGLSLGEGQAPSEPSPGEGESPAKPKSPKSLKPGGKILVCDVGGGTTDFTLIEVLSPGSGEGARFHRCAVGDHLILGGDNLDLALAHFVEDRLGEPLPARQWSALVRRCRSAKELLLGESAPETTSISVPGSGTKLIGGARQIEVSQQEVATLLVDGFLPLVGKDEKPLKRTSGFQEFGLPYAPDPAISRYLGAFLSAHGQAKPDYLLFNGGLFQSAAMRSRLLEILGDWHGSQPEVLKNERLDLAVAIGAAFYGMIRAASAKPKTEPAQKEGEGGGQGSQPAKPHAAARLRITGGLARSYYIGVEHNSEWKALCLAAAGQEEGDRVELDREFGLLVRQPVEFPLYASSTRTNDRPGDLVKIDPEQITALAPIKTVLRSKAGGESAENELLKVRLHAELTEIGTLEVWCSEVGGKRRWKLPFDVRSAYRADLLASEEGEGNLQPEPGTGSEMVEESLIADCRESIRSVFAEPIGTGKSARQASAEGLVASLEELTGTGRFDWPPSLLRNLWEELMADSAGRNRSPIHEARWLNLTGFALRPGYGMAADDWRVGQTWQLFEKKVAHERNELCRAEWWILWRRIAGGLSQGQQRTIADPLLAIIRKARAKGAKLPWGTHEHAEILRLLASLELLTPEVKTELGDTLGHDKVSVWALGRLGARNPIYGPLNTVVPWEVAARWAEKLLKVPRPDSELYFSLMLLSRRTGDRYRDLPPEIRERILERMSAAPSHLAELVRHGGELAQSEKNKAFGESLPRGLRML